MNSFDAVTPGRTICLETASHKSPSASMVHRESSTMHLILCLNTLTNATNYFHFTPLGFGILVSNLTYASIVFPFLYLFVTSFATYSSNFRLESLTGSSYQFTVQGVPFQSLLLCWANTIECMHGLS